MSEEQKQTFYKIISDTWKMFKDDAALVMSLNVDPGNDTLEIWKQIVQGYVDYEQKWKPTAYWKFAVAECSAKLTALEELAKRRTA